MADQVNPSGSLTPGLPTALLVASQPRPAKAHDPPAKPAGIRPVVASVESSDRAVEQLNRHFQQTGTELKFQVDRESGRTLFKIISEKSREVLLQVPSEEVLAMARKLRDVAERLDAAGVLVDKEG